MSSFTFSNNLVEVGALTALVGSSIAESLILGNRGAAGIAWAATSSFGAMSIVKACISGACSGWLRESLGIRTTESDEAVGMELPQDSPRAGKLRRNTAEPLAIYCHAAQRDAKGEIMQGASTDVYAIEYCTSSTLRWIPETAAGSPIQVFAYANYIFFRHHSALFQVPALLLSAAKISEMYVLWRLGATISLGLISALPWIYFFMGALAIEIEELLLSRRREPELGDLDIVTGQLPMAGHRGGPRKIILGAREDPRTTSFAWRIFWAGGALISTASVIILYVVMAQEPRTTVFTWAGFQLLWLVVRILVYHFAEPPNPMRQRFCVGRPYETLSDELKTRVVNLAFALARSQTAVHPRGQEQYAGDAFSTDALRLVRDHPAKNDVIPLPATHVLEFRIEIKAVIGDTALSAAMWMAGAETTPMDLYDSCIVVFAVPNLEGVIAVPAVRVLSGVIARAENKDAESDIPVFVLKGSPSTGTGLTWWFWIPCEGNVWLEVPVPVMSPLRLLGTQNAALRTDGQLSAKLDAGKMNISLKNVDDVKEVVALSRQARDSFLALLE